MSTLQRELAIRKRVLDIFNKSQTDFSTDEDWFNYQEQIEDHILSLVEGQNVQHTEAAIEEYRKANYDSIVANDARKRGRPKAAAPVAAKDNASSDNNSNLPAPTARPVGYQPQPIGPAASHMGSALNHMTAEQQMRMSLASGWHPSMVHKRALQLAFSGLVV